MRLGKLIQASTLAVGLSLGVATPVLMAVAPAPAEAIQLRDVYNDTRSGVLCYSTGNARVTIPAGGASTVQIARIVVPARWAFTVTITNTATGAKQDRTVYGGTGGNNIYLGTLDSVRVKSTWVYM